MGAEAEVEISIAMVGHEHRAHLERALGAVLDGGVERSFEVIFVDNDSRDGSAELVASLFPEVRLVRNVRRRGFSANNNVAFSLSRGRCFLVLNPDTRARPGAIDRLADYLDQHPDVGVVGPRLVFPDGRLQLSCRRFPTVRSFLWRRTPLRLLREPEQRDARHLMAEVAHDEPGPVDWLLGAALMVRREVWEQVAGMDEGYALYCEDIDFCYRVHRAGFGVHYCPGAVVEHDHLAETDHTFFTRRTLWHYRSMLRYLVRHGVAWS